MGTTSITQKEEFFRTKLIPAGQVVELYLHHMSYRNRAEVSRVLFETFGLLSVFVISPATAPEKSLFAALGQTMQSVIAMLRGDLLALNCDKPTSEQLRAFRASQNTIVARVEPLVSALLASMEYTAEGRGKWLEKLMEQKTPLTPGREYKKWRTFVRNLDFEKNMQTLGLAKAAKEMPTLGSHQGKEEAPSLWRACFDASWPEGAGNVEGPPYLPAGVVVKSTSTGMLEVTHSFDHYKVLKKTLLPLTVRTPDVTARLDTAFFSKTCYYTELAEVVAEVLAWVDEQVKMADATKEIVSEAVEASKVDALRTKLNNTFSPEELEMLSKVVGISSAPVKAKAAARPRARKS